MATEISIDDILNPERLDSIEQDVSKDVQREIAAQLQHDLAMPLPDDAEGKAKVIRDRQTLIDSIRTLDKTLNITPPELLEAPSRKDTDAYEPEFLIDKRMPADRLTILTGEGGIGKSYLALQHIAGLAMGITDYFLKPYHGAEEELYSEDSRAFRKDPIKVVIASYEEDLAETWKRIASICDWLGWADYDKLTKQIRFVDLKMFGPIWGVGQDTHLATRAKLLEVGDWLLKECQDFRARLLMLDPSAGVYGANENARESVREFCSHLNGWGQDPKVQCATLLIAHPNKAGEYSGNTDWLGSCRAMWKLAVEEENRGTKNKPDWHYWYQITNVKQNYAAPQRKIYLQKIKKADGKWTPIWVKCSQEEAEDFYAEYGNPTEQSNRNTQENTHDDDNPYANAFK